MSFYKHLFAEKMYNGRFPGHHDTGAPSVSTCSHHTAVSGTTNIFYVYLLDEKLQLFPIKLMNKRINVNSAYFRQTAKHDIVNSIKNIAK